jgi:LmbE family N-acetylglucosaminyl deacetylase
MTVLCFEPHSDDATLFCAFSAMQHRAHVVTILASHVQFDRGRGITQQQRLAENQAAMRELGLTHEQWHYSDALPDWDAVEAAMRVAADLHEPEIVFAPAPDFEANGHHEDRVPPNGWGVMQHDMVGNLAGRVFEGRARFYTTYTRGNGRTVTGTPVTPTPDQIARKLRALACFRSQIAEETTRAWFMGPLGEWLA